MGKIVWLASYPKSGNTWLRAFLHNYITQPATPHSINRLHELSASECNAVFYRKYDPRPASQYSTRDVQRMRPAVQEDLTRLHDDLVFIKTHNARLNFHDVPLCTPAVTAGAIYIVRDPRDVAISYSAYTGLGIDAVIGLMGEKNAAIQSTDTQVFEFLSSWSNHVTSWMGQAKKILVRYEDLLAEPETAFGKVVRFLGDEHPSQERLRRAIEFSSFGALSTQEAADGYAANAPNSAAAFFRQGRAGQWREILSAAQIERIETDHAATMKRFAYI
jgi:hypothetical protein